jgi:hypothetical protein
MPSRLKSLQPRSAIIEAEEVEVMKTGGGYQGYVIETRVHELPDGGFSAEFSVEEHDGWRNRDAVLPA